jgi:hypothetical protein
MHQTKNPLEELIERLNRQAEVNSVALYKALGGKAQRDHDLAVLIASMNGKSQAEKVSLAEGTKRYLEIHDAYNKLESRSHLEKMKYEVLKLEFNAQYLTQKQDGDEIERLNREPGP